MTGNHSTLPKLPLRLSPLQILGLLAPEEGDWARLRALQYAQLHRAALTRAIAHALAVLLTLSIFIGKVPLWLLGGWVVAVGAAVWNSTRVDRSLADIDRRSMARHEFNRHAVAVAARAAPWGVALAAFVPFSSHA